MSRTSLVWIVAIICLADLSAPQPSSAQSKQLGKVHFATSCKPEAQKLFDCAMLYQHSFWYRVSKQAFEDVIKSDPDCAMAFWGIAQSLLLNPFSPPPKTNLPEGLAAIEKARSIGAKTERERDFIEALGAFYTDHDKVDHRSRVQAFVKAMEGVAERNRKDDEAQIFYALALNVGASPADKTYANQLKAAGILEKIFRISHSTLVSPTTSSIPTTTRRSLRRAWPPPNAIRRSHLLRHTRNTCRGTYSPGSAIGRI